MRTSDPLAHALGLVIIEGPKPEQMLVLWTLSAVLTLCSGSLIAYLVRTTGIGGMVFAVPTLLWMGAKIIEQGEE